MFPLEIVLLGFALAMDAAVVCFALGLTNHELETQERWKRGVIASLCFGFFQFLMLWVGSYGGYLFTFSSYGYLFQFIVAAIFFVISLKFLQESFSHEERDLSWKILPILVLAGVTSIDALAAGISFGSMPRAHIAAMEVGVITFATCLTCYGLSQVLRDLHEKWLLRFASVIFLFLGGHIVYSYILRGNA
jgi:manganese efflux pump family protein